MKKKESKDKEPETKIENSIFDCILPDAEEFASIENFKIPVEKEFPYAELARQAKELKKLRKILDGFMMGQGRFKEEVINDASYVAKRYAEDYCNNQADEFNKKWKEHSNVKLKVGDLQVVKIKKVEMEKVNEKKRTPENSQGNIF